jgi:hypothetical protein
MKTSFTCLLLSVTLFLISCGGENTSSNVEAPGDQKSTKDKVLTAGADIIQDKTPLKGFDTYLDGFHFYNGNMGAQMEAHHYVNQVNEDLYQAIIFDGNGRDAKLMGIEYIVTEKLFKTLSKEEKLLWHSHKYEVSSGSLIAPAIPKAAEHELMEKLISTYGKTIHTWHTDQERNLPVGSPMIMMGFTKDGQLDKKMLADRDQRFKVNSGNIKDNRKDIPLPITDPDANGWETGRIRQFIITNKADSAVHKH